MLLLYLWRWRQKSYETIFKQTKTLLLVQQCLYDYDFLNKYLVFFSIKKNKLNEKKYGCHILFIYVLYIIIY